jgi:hypothetical protein
MAGLMGERVDRLRNGWVKVDGLRSEWVKERMG